MERPVLLYYMRIARSEARINLLSITRAIKGEKINEKSLVALGVRAL